MNLSRIAIAIFKYRKMLTCKHSIEQEKTMIAYRSLILKHYNKLTSNERQRVVSMANYITE